jgi:hypothetical protein
MIPEELLDTLAEAGIGTLWVHFKLLEPGKKVLSKVKNGVTINCPIRVFIEGYYEEFPNSGKVRVRGFGLTDLYKFKDEEDERKELMLKFIYDNYNKDVTEGRVEDD